MRRRMNRLLLVNLFGFAGLGAWLAMVEQGP
jgi:hypothetical protein